MDMDRRMCRPRRRGRRPPATFPTAGCFTKCSAWADLFFYPSPFLSGFATCFSCPFHLDRINFHGYWGAYVGICLEFLPGIDRPVSPIRFDLI
ncbi:hypothetical protein VTN49DRAFT_6551 [Thermomyces lanuginosus]|uniref:uncharacterized protein n=1 Tax=Thermomyces lanuginosus TaxID=5541 RepID=UPI003742FBC6